MNESIVTAEPEPITPTPVAGLTTSWEGLAVSATGSARLRVTVTDLADTERAQLRVEVESDPESDVGVYTREPGQGEPGLGLLLRAEGLWGVTVVSGLLRLLADKVDGVLLLASVPGDDNDPGSAPTPPSALDLDTIRALLAAGGMPPKDEL